MGPPYGKLPMLFPYHSHILERKDTNQYICVNHTSTSWIQFYQSNVEDSPPTSPRHSIAWHLVDHFTQMYICNSVGIYGCCFTTHGTESDSHHVGTWYVLTSITDRIYIQFLMVSQVSSINSVMTCQECLSELGMHYGESTGSHCRQRTINFTNNTGRIKHVFFAKNLLSFSHAKKLGKTTVGVHQV